MVEGTGFDRDVLIRAGVERTDALAAYGVSRIAQMLAHCDLDIVSTLDDGQIELVRIEAPPHLVGRTVV